MKLIDFSSNKSTTYKPVNEERVDEFLGALLILGCAGMMASKAMLGWWGSIQGLRSTVAKNKAERAESKTKMMQEKTKQMEEVMKRYQMLFGKSREAADKGATDPDGNNMEELGKSLARAARGEATDDDIALIGKCGKRKPTKEETNIIPRVETSANKYTLNDINSYCKEQGIPENTDIDAVTKMMDEHKTAMQQALPPKSENKSDDEIRQEIKDKLKDTKEEEIPQSLKTNDGKLDVEKLDKSTGDDLVTLAKDSGVDPVKSNTQTTQTTQKPQNPDEEWVDDDGTKYTKIGDKYTMTTKDGDSIELTQDEYENHIENDDVKDAERVDNDDDIDDIDYSNKEDLAKDPRKKYKQRTYKRGSKTFKTKSYYDKKGNSISKEDFQKMYDAWKERQSKGKKKTTTDNNSLFSVTRLIDIKKTPANMNEANMVTDREGICKERLAYIKYVIDTTDNSVEKVRMKRMYDAIYNLTFGDNGKLRSLKDLYSYIDHTMIENKGKIPGLPTETQIENIDEKVQAFKELHTHEFESYIKQIDKKLLDKSDRKSDDAADDLLHPDKKEMDAQTIDDIRKLSSTYGFTNILGLEPERKPSKKDVDDEEEVTKQRKDGSPNASSKDSKDVKADDVSDEQIDKIIGVSK